MKSVYKTRVTVMWIDGSKVEFVKEIIATSYPDAITKAIANASDMGHPVEVYASYTRPVTDTGQTE